MGVLNCTKRIESLQSSMGTIQIKYTVAVDKRRISVARWCDPSLERGVDEKFSFESD